MATTRRPSLPKTREMAIVGTPMLVETFGERVGKELEARDRARTHTPSGLISGSKIGQPTLWAVLDMLGELRAEHDAYTLGKFQRGHDVEARTINMLTGLQLQYIVDILDGIVENPGWIKLESGNILSGEVYLQYKQGYRGGTGYVDLAQRTETGEVVFHEVKSSTKMAYDKVAATGRSSAGKPEPYVHHALQLAYYALGAGVNRAFVHYMNADDYRMCSFAINPIDYKEEIDRQIDDIQNAFALKSLPAFEPVLEFQRIRNYQ